MNDKTYRKYNVRASNTQPCGRCRSDGMRLHNAEVMLGSGDDRVNTGVEAPCYNCRWEEFRLYISGMGITDVLYERIIDNYNELRRR